MKQTNNMAVDLTKHNKKNNVKLISVNRLKS